MEFLKSFTPNLEQEKMGNGLKAYYNTVAKQFLQKWPVKVTDEEQEAAGEGEGEDPQSLAVTR